MPIMKGDTALKHIMIRHPIPVLMVSSFDTDSLGKIFEFMQLGAVDFIPKPGAREDMVAYGERLCDLVKRAAKADTRRFRRFRRLKEKASSPLNTGSTTGPPKGVLVILGAEGAFMDWLRLPLADLCNSGLVIGLQKLEDRLVSVFCRFIRESVSIRAEPAPSSGSIAPGSLFLGNANCRVALSADRQSMALTITAESPSGKMEWHKGIESWLGGLAEQFQDHLSVYLLSGAHALEPAVIDRLMEYESRLILSPRENVMCVDLVESVRDYGYLYPEKIIWSTSEELPKAIGWECIQ
jgi:two-component system chemotaxis response regulator CheB